MTLTDHPRLVELLAGILADPSCDAVRLAYADALAELGDGDRAAQEHAEFVRVGVELARLDGRASGVAPMALLNTIGPRQALRRRERELLTEHGVAWLHDSNPDLSWEFIVPGTPKELGEVRLGYRNGPPPYLLVEFRRGFVESVTMPASALPHLDAVREVQPVTKVTLTTWPDPAELTALTIRRGKQPGVADTEETSATRWCLQRLWPGIEEWTLPGGRAAVT